MTKSKKIGLVVSLVAVAVLVNSVGAFGADWPNWRGPDHNGISKETGWDPATLKDGAKILWKASVGTGFSAVSVAKGKAYTMGNIDATDYVYCFDALTGKEIWTHKYSEKLRPKLYEGGPNATVTVDGGKVYTISKSGKIFCLNADTGKEIWKKSLTAEMPKWGYSGSALIVDDMVIFNAGSLGIAYKKATGKVVWKSGEEATGYSTPVAYTLDDKECVAIFTTKLLVGVEIATGKKQWEFEWKTKYGINASDPIIDGDKVFITSGYNQGCALVKIDGGKAESVWVNHNMHSQLSGPVLLDGYVYGIDDKQLACVEMKSGDLKWTSEVSAKGSLMAADGKLIILSEKGKLIIAEASPESFKEIASAKILKGKCWTMPVLANGKIYARNADGDMVCVDMSIKK